jgi:hypothetical protein
MKMVVEAVSCEPVSASAMPANREITAHFAEFGRSRAKMVAIQLASSTT